jgi:hypothetical protein
VDLKLLPLLPVPATFPSPNHNGTLRILDENNIVTEVIVGKNEGEEGTDWEVHYGNFRGQVCKRTSYNTHGGVTYWRRHTVPQELRRHWLHLRRSPRCFHPAAALRKLAAR